MFTVYVLKCQENKYYVGETTDLDARYEQHKNGEGSEWTRLYPPIKIQEKYETNNDKLELKKTLEYMKKYGIENVRGGGYCQRDLSENLEEINRYLSSTCGLCGKHGHIIGQCGCDLCGGYDHLINQCKNCYKCGKSGHYASDCNDDRRGHHANNDSRRDRRDYANDRDDSRSDYSNDGRRGHANDDRRGHANQYCYECGRAGHYANDCSMRNQYCYECGRPGHYANNCNTRNQCCYKCGRPGHYANDCRRRREDSPGDIYYIDYSSDETEDISGREDSEDDDYHHNYYNDCHYY